MRHPIDWLPEARGLASWTRWIAGAISGALILVCLPRSSPPPTPLTPNRILELELAGTRDGALTLLRAFDAESRRTRTDFRAQIRQSIWWDFGLIGGYPVFLALMIGALSGSLRSGERTTLDAAAAWSAILAGALDLIENAGMLLMLRMPVVAAPSYLGKVAFVGTLASFAKWVLVTFSVLYAAWLLIRYLLGKLEIAGGRPQVPAR